MTSAVSGGTIGYVPTYQASDSEWKILPDGRQYKGPTDSKGKPHGQGEMKYPAKDPHKIDYTGEFDHGERHGKGIVRWKDGETYDGSWENDRMHGKGVHKKKDYTDELTYQWNLTKRKSLPEGIIKRTYHDGGVYSGTIVNDLPYDGTLTTSDGQIYDYKKGVKSNEPLTKKSAVTSSLITSTPSEVTTTPPSVNTYETDKNYSMVYLKKDTINTTRDDEVTVYLKEDESLQKKPLLSENEEDKECCARCSIL